MQCYYRFFYKTGLRELDNVHNSRVRNVVFTVQLGNGNIFPHTAAANAETWLS